MCIIRALNLGVKFRRYQSTKLRLRSLLLDPRRTHLSGFWALRNLSFEVEEGEILGVIGANGAGKSTLLRVIAGIYPPDEGSIQVDGKVSPLLSLGAGFRPDLSGRDNIYLNGVLLGLSKQKIDALYDEIVSFAELEEFVDEPVRTYSSGMIARLGFSIAMSVRPDILLIDEVLGVGDMRFQQKSKERMRQFMEHAKAIIVATHSMGFIRELCTRVIWLERGSVRMIGDTRDVVSRYLQEGNVRVSATGAGQRGG